MKRLIFLFIIAGTFIVNKGEAQQNPMFTQYMFNPYLINPAIAGTFNYYQIRSAHRFQWVGAPGSYPVTNSISVYGPLENQPMGLGGSIYHDMFGPNAVLGTKFSYAYYYPITPQYKISGGLSLGILQYSQDGNQVSLEDPEPGFQEIRSKIRPDASVGIYFFSSNLNVGISADQIFRPIVNWEATDSSETVAGRLISHFYFMAGYKYFLNRDWSIEPTLVLKKSKPAPTQLDFSVKGIYQNMVWAGISGRTGESIFILIRLYPRQQN
jgi:type IX secretion system PorP/SprF family membrane protein